MAIFTSFISEQHPPRRIAAGGGDTPRSRKNCCRKMVLFPNGLFLVTNFPKIIIQFFKCIFIKNFQNFANHLCDFCPKSEKWMHRLVKFFDKYAKIIHFRKVLKNLFEDFRNFLKFSQQCVFPRNAPKINAWFVKFFWKLS